MLLANTPSRRGKPTIIHVSMGATPLTWWPSIPYETRVGVYTYGMMPPTHRQQEARDGHPQVVDDVARVDDKQFAEAPGVPQHQHRHGLSHEGEGRQLAARSDQRAINLRKGHTATTNMERRAGRNQASKSKQALEIQQYNTGSPSHHARINLEFSLEIFCQSPQQVFS